MKIAHIINHVNVPKSSDLHIAQPITFETMRRAKAYAKLSEDIEVDLLVCGYEEDSVMTPEGFVETSHLSQSLMEVGSFSKTRKLPLIKDILDKAIQYSAADTIVYTNVDIGLQPYFYNAVAGIMKRGTDSFIINRRTISDEYVSIDDIESMWSQVGQIHPGLDCFVFQKKDYQKYMLGNTCIGAGYIGKVMAVNMIVNSSAFELFKDEHLTFHIGNDQIWNQNANHEYSAHNLAELNTVLDHYESVIAEKDHPIIQNALKRRHDDARWAGGRSKPFGRECIKLLESKIKKVFK